MSVQIHGDMFSVTKSKLVKTQNELHAFQRKPIKKDTGMSEVSHATQRSEWEAFGIKNNLREIIVMIFNKLVFTSISFNRPKYRLIQ